MQKVFGRSPWASNYNRVYSLPCWKGMATCIYTIKHNGGGVKKSGAYPLNRGEVTDWQLAPSLATNPSCKTNSSDTSLDLSANSSSHASEKSSSSLSIQFSPCQEELYQKRYEEGYDLLIQITRNGLTSTILAMMILLVLRSLMRLALNMLMPNQV